MSVAAAEPTPELVPGGGTPAAGPPHTQLSSTAPALGTQWLRNGPPLLPPTHTSFSPTPHLGHLPTASPDDWGSSALTPGPGRLTVLVDVARVSISSWVTQTFPEDCRQRGDLAGPACGSPSVPIRLGPQGQAQSSLPESSHRPRPEPCPLPSCKSHCQAQGRVT